MNQSIYLMIAVPYLSLAVLGFLIYRGCKKNAEFRKALEQTSLAVSPAQELPSPGPT
jgi:hypothetical protein